MGDDRTALDHDEALRLLAFLLSSAEGCLKEPLIYGVYRLGTAAVQLAEAWQPRANSETAGVLRELTAHWQREAGLLSHDPAALKAFLQDANVAIADEIHRQSGQGA